MVRVGLIGYGYWGPNLVRSFAEVDGVEMAAVCDKRDSRLALAQRRYPGITLFTDYTEMVSDPKIDAIVIATPVSTHFDLAIQALETNKHVLVEKPLAATSEQVVRLIKEAKHRNRVLMVDHTFIYTGAVQKIHELVTSNQVGEIYYYDSVRVNLGLFQHDVNVIWDLAVHDLSIMDYVLPSVPNAVSATGMSHIPNEPENIAYLTLFFEGSLIAHIHINWLAPVKVRRTLISGSHKMIVYDDLESSEKLKVYDKGITVSDQPEQIYKMLISYRMGDMWAPQLDMTEALLTEVMHFVECIERNKRPITDGQSGLRVVKILEAATRSMREQGRPIELDMKEV
jgi:predicted dehydrogenase